MNLQAVLAHRFAPVEHSWNWRDSALYALALGMAQDPLDADELPYVYEKYVSGQWGAAGQLRAVPSMAVTLGWLPFWQDEPALAIDWPRIVHGEMRFTLHQALPVQGRVRATHRIAAVDDKGPGRGAVMHVDKELHDAATGAPLASLQSLEFLRGDGGCGHWPAAGVAAAARAGQTPLPPDFAPTARMDVPTTRQAALVYRLASGDLMPIHADPEVARRAGFERPISHGLNNLGIACRAVLKHFARGAPELIREMGVRFVQPGLPGDTVRVQMQRRGDTVHFSATALERDVLLLDRGHCRLGAAPAGQAP